MQYIAIYCTVGGNKFFMSLWKSKLMNGVGVARPEPRPALQLSCTGREQRGCGGKQSRTVYPYASGTT